MELSQLRTFALLAENGSFTRVARELNISQPAVSVQIQSLELELGVRLFERLPRRVKLTEAGEVLYDYARQILNLEANARRLLDELQAEQETYLHIGASPTIGAYVLPGLLRAFEERYHHVRVIAEIQPSYDIITAIEGHSYDLGFIETEVESDNLLVTPFMQDDLVLVVNRSHPWAGGGEVEATELSAQSWITREPGSGTRAWIDEQLAQHEINITADYELGDVEAIKNAVSSGLGVALLSHCAVAQEVATGTLAIARIRGIVLNRQFYCLYTKQRYLSAITRAFREFVSNSAGNPFAPLV